MLLKPRRRCGLWTIERKQLHPPFFAKNPSWLDAGREGGWDRPDFLVRNFREPKLPDRYFVG